MNEVFYNRMGEVFKESIPYEKYISGKMSADTAILFDFKSKLDIHKPDNSSNAQMDSAVNAGIALNDSHILYTVIPNSQIEKIFDKKVVIITNAPFSFSFL
jgi:hypothetical protein